MLQGRRGSRVGTWLLLLLVAAGPTDRSTQEFLRLFPDLPYAMASHLVNDDAEQFARYAARTDWGSLYNAYLCLTRQQPTASLPEFLHAEDLTRPYVHRLLVAMNSPGLTDKDVAYSRLSPEDRIERARLCQAIDAIDTDTTSVEKRMETALRLIERAKAYPHDIPNMSHLYGRYADFLGQLGRRDETPPYLRAAAEAALASGDTTMACQYLGMLGVYYAQDGEYESMRRYYDRALAVARLSGNWQEVRILSFYSFYYQSQGQIAIARDLVLEYQDLSRRFDPQVGLRFSNDALLFFAGLQCWDEVGRGLRRTEMILEECRPQLSPADAELEETRLQVLRARYYAATGRSAEALELAREIVNRVDGWNQGPARAAYIRLSAARVLASSGATPEVRTILEQSFEQCIKAAVRGPIDGHAIELAQVYLDLGDLDACQRTLDTYPAGDSFRHAILKLRLAILRKDRPGAFAKLKVALDLLEAMERKVGASPEAYIAVALADELRLLGHELLDGSAAASYAFEMQWRQPLGPDSRFSGSIASELTCVSTLVAESEAMLGRLRARNAVHCVYDVRRDGVVRLTADGSGVQQEWLACSPGALEALVNRVSASLATPSPRSDSLDARQTEDLRQLATWLLPDSLTLRSGTRLLLATANGCLSRLRFEALNVGTQDYVPLLNRVDVASMRHWREIGEPREDSTLVVSDPVYSATMRRRYSILTETLPASAVEAATALNLLPGAISLSGPAATKHNIIGRWQRARVVYFTGHAIQDPELPYLMFIPVSESPDGNDGDSYLEVADVRNADLSGCQLVVMSSCASGAPYLEGKVEVPSLADVFLDAGAHAVVSTGWTVRDDDAARFMNSFLRLYAATPNDPVTALCNARRAVAAITKDPHIWAAYSITLGGLPATLAMQ